jgi:DNA-binding response OmpR family regulator
VEDQPSIRKFVTVALERAGFSVFWAIDADHAVQTFRDRSGAIDLVVTDVMMPGASGPSLARRLQVMNPSLKVLFLSGSDLATLVEEDSMPSDAPFLKKPFTGDELVKKVRETLQWTGSDQRRPGHGVRGAEAE